MKPVAFVKKRPKSRRPRGPWSLEEMKQVAMNYKTRTELQVKNQALYQAARLRNILDEICTHMPEPKNKRKHYIVVPNAYTLIAPALQCSDLREFVEKHRGAYNEGLRCKIDYVELFDRSEDPQYLKGLIKNLAEEAALRAPKTAEL